MPALDPFGFRHECSVGLLILSAVVVSVVFGHSSARADESPADEQFRKLGLDYLDQFAAFSPVSSTLIGDHRFDDRLDEVGEQAQKKKLEWIGGMRDRLAKIDREKLSRGNQVDAALLDHELKYQAWKIETLREWEWNPLVYTGLSGDAIYGLLARDFASIETRLDNAEKRMRQLPRFFAQVRDTLDPSRTPKIHVETAIGQNRGMLTTIEKMLRPALANQPDDRKTRLAEAITVAERAIAEQQTWLEEELLPQAGGNERIGAELYDQKLAFALHSPMTREEIRERANERLRDLHERMYEIAKPLYRQRYPLTDFPDEPSEAFRRAVIRFGLELASREAPARDEVVETANESVAAATEFIREEDLISLVDDRLRIIVMPEFRRGVSLAYCDSPGPLEVDQPTFYAVSPPPASWSTEQVESWLREYNTRSIDILTIHEAVPGHFLQLAFSNRYEGRLRHFFQSGVFIEGWAVYVEWMMCEEGFRDHDPLLKLVALKWYLRDTTNALIDQAVHVDGITREEGMRMLMEDAFQEEREAAGKWTRARLTSAQLPTYCVGYLEHIALRADAEERWGNKFDLKTYHDRVLSFGSPPPQFVRALLFDEPIP